MIIVQPSICIKICMYYTNLLIFLYVTRCDKIGLIARKYMFLLNNVYLHFCVSYNNSVRFSKISINLYISDEKLNSCQLHT